MPNIRRKFSGPYGYLNFIPDNNEIELTRDAFGYVIRIDTTGPAGQQFYRIFTRDVGTHVITDIGYWIQIP